MHNVHHIGKAEGIQSLVDCGFLRVTVRVLRMDSCPQNDIFSIMSVKTRRFIKIMIALAMKCAIISHTSDAGLEKPVG